LSASAVPVRCRRIAGRTLADHIAAMQRYWNAVADLL